MSAAFLPPVFARHRRTAAAMLLVAITFVVYAGALGNGFVWDDEWVVGGGPPRDALRSIGHALLSPDEVKPYYRPVTRALFVLERAVFATNASVFHAVSLAFHAASVVLLFALLGRMFGSPWPPFAAALLLAVHPVNSEAVDFITARNNVMALAFMLASLLSFRRSLEGPAGVWPWVTGGFVLLALGCKEPAITVLPLLVVLLIAGRRRLDRPIDLRSVAPLVPAALATVVYLALRYAALDGFLGSTEAAPPIRDTMPVALAIVPRYLALIAWPAGLTVFHDVPRAVDALSWHGVLGWLALGAVTALAVSRPTPPATLGLTWLALNLVPIVGLVAIPSAVVAERYLYVPAVGVWMVAADLLARLGDIVRPPRVIAGAFGVCVALLAWRTAERTRDWNTDVSLFASAVRVDPRSAVALFNLGTALREAGDSARARHYWQQAVLIDPGYAEALTNLGTEAAVDGRLHEAEALYARALASNPAFAMAHFNMARLLERTGRARAAAPHYEAFLRHTSPRYHEFAGIARERLRALRGT